MTAFMNPNAANQQTTNPNTPITGTSTLYRQHAMRYRRGQTIYYEGDPALSLFRVEAGLIRITKLTPRGRVLTVRHVLPGDFFGEEAFNRNWREHQVEALTDATITPFDPSNMTPESLLTITKNMAEQMQRVMHYEYHLQIGDLRQRVARYLLELAKTPLGGLDDNGLFFVRATHELLAEGTSSTRESVSKIITELRADGLIQSGYRRITLVNTEELQALSEAGDLDGSEEAGE
jgi:CRP/FNR family transcriptional regulator, LitR-dependent transcriptional activator